jgi:transposase
VFADPFAQAHRRARLQTVGSRLLNSNEPEVIAVRVTTAFKRLLDLPGVWVKKVSYEPDRIEVTVTLRTRRLQCPKCSYSTPHRESVQHHDSIWRHLDLGTWRLEVHARLRRLRCPQHGVLVEGVPFARYGARFTRDFEDLVAWLASKTDKSAICRLVRIDWQTVGRIIERVGDERLPVERLDDLFEVSIDEVAWRKGHRYLTLVGDHRRGVVVWGTEGKGAAKAFKDARWSLLKNPGDLSDRQADTLAALQAAGGKTARAWMLKEMVRAIFAPGLTPGAVAELIERLLSRLSRSRLKPFVRLGRTIRKHREGILAARRLGITNARAEALNNKVKLIVRRAYGFHSARAALALIHLICGPVTLPLPHERKLA